jgi:coenzyme F420 biosynthesis associated uncharacterized protein
MAGAVDWSVAERVAIRLAGSEPLADSYLAESLAPDFAEKTPVAELLVGIETGLHSSLGPARGVTVDRADWIRANIASFQRLLAPLLTKLDEKANRSPIGAAVTGRAAGAEVGAMLGWMSGRVLGQYDVLVGGDDTAGTATGDCVYYVAPNVLAVEKRYGFAPDQFRMWLALHEVSHRAQFTGVPWMRDHFLSLTHEVLNAADPDPARILSAIRGALTPGEAKKRITDGGLLALVATAEQRVALARIGGMMALLEGHGDVTMNRAGTALVPQAERFDRVLKQRRASGSPAVRLLQRLAGIEAKMNQYELGERFIAAIEANAGRRAVDRCWESSEHLPTMDEIRDPNQWLRRLGVPATA